MSKYQEAAKLLNLVQKAGARHSARDNDLIQQMHDRACELGARCNCETPTHPMLKGALVERHGAHNQKTHGHRHGVGGLKEFAKGRGYQVRQVAGRDGKTELAITDKRGASMRAGNLTGARKLITEASKRKRQSEKQFAERKKQSQRQIDFIKADTPQKRTKIADEMLKHGGLADKSVAKTAGEIPSLGYANLRPGTIGSRGKNAVFLDENGTHSFGPVVKDEYGDYYTGTFGKVRKVRPEFAGSK
jgi:hypothetical protein